VATTLLGLEIDGDRVTLVEVSGGLAVSTRTVSHQDLESAIELALAGYKQKRTDLPIRVVLGSPGVNMRRIDVTAALLSRAAFEDVAFSALPVPRETNSSAGMFFQPNDLQGDIVTAGVAVIAPSLQVDKAYKSLGRRNTELVAPPTVFSGLDGIWLGIRHRTADVTLVADGRPVAYRQLRTGGLDAVASALGDGAAGYGRLNTALHHSGMTDHIAEAELSRYLNALAAEFRQTCDYWARSGESVPSTVAPYGAGATSLGLEKVLNDQGFAVGMHPEVERRLVYLPAADRMSAVAGFLAAVTSGSDMPQVAFVNPHAIALAEETSRRDRRARRVLTAAVGAGVIALVGGIPYLSSQLSLRDARADLVSAQSDFNQSSTGYIKLQDTKNRLNASESVLSVQPFWSGALSVTFATMPLRAEIRDLSAVVIDGQIRVRTTAELNGGSYADLSNWLEKLRGTANITAAWSESFSDRDGRAVFEVSFNLAKPEAVTEPNPAIAEDNETGTSDKTAPTQAGADSINGGVSTTEPSLSTSGASGNSEPVAAGSTTSQATQNKEGTQ